MADAGALGRGRLGEDDGPVRVHPGGQKRETVLEQVGTSHFEDPTTVDQEGDETGQSTVVPSRDLEQRETVQTQTSKRHLAVLAELLVSQRGAPETHQHERGRRGRLAQL